VLARTADDETISHFVLSPPGLTAVYGVGGTLRHGIRQV